MGIWFDINGSAQIAANSLGNQAQGTGQGQSAIPLSQNFAFAGVNAKIGYAFPLVSNVLQLIPYALVGRNTNLAASTVLSNNLGNFSNDYFYTGGFGARLEYRINRYIDLYADQNATYNWDQSGPQSGIQPQNNMIFTSTLGAKFKPFEDFQYGKDLIIGVNGFYSNYQYVATAPNITTTPLIGGCSGAYTCSIYQPQNTFGGMITVGLTY